MNAKLILSNISLLLAGGVAALPPNYTPLAWIQSTGQQYVRTDISASPTLQAWMDFEPGERTAAINFGTMEKDDETDWRFVDYTRGALFDCGTTRMLVGETILDNHVRYQVAAGTEGRTVFFAVTNAASGACVLRRTAPLAGSIHPGKICLFGGYETARKGVHCTLMKLHGFALTEVANGARRGVARFVPCRAPTGEAGLWDEIGGKFHGNAGTGKFVGSDERPNGYGTVIPARSFAKARPVWPSGRRSLPNDSAGFRAGFDLKAGEAPVLRVTGSSIYRIRLNGRYMGYGPARCAKGVFRVDEWPLAAAAQPGRNILAIEANAYNQPLYCQVGQPGFLQAEVVVGDRVLAATGSGGEGAFTAHELSRVRKVQRFSFQRAFCEEYNVDASWDRWIEDGRAPLPLEELAPTFLIDRVAPLPDFSLNTAFKPWRNGQPAPAQKSYALTPQTDVLFNVGLNDTGFLGVTVKCTKPGRLCATFDERLVDGQVKAKRNSMNLKAVWNLLAPGTYQLELIEPNVMHYVHFFMESGEAEISKPFIRAYKNGSARQVKFLASDPLVEKIFVAARETFAQNAVDVFTDCPGRERAGWLADSAFLGRAAEIFTGGTDQEKLYLQNYLLPVQYEHLPTGMVPMCYPSDHPNHRFIVNWALWLVFQLGDYAQAGGDRTLVAAFKPRLLELMKYLEQFENADGLLERLPSWIFIEWSRANQLVQDVNYPTNMEWAEAMDILGRLYDLPTFTAKANRVRETIRRQAWTGRWFCDNARRQPDGTLKLSGECTETCQYYAFYTHTATFDRDAELWRTLVRDFGPGRKGTLTHPEVFPANLLHGDYLRLFLLARNGRADQLLRESKDYLGAMATATGTLWENDTPHASCNHGFASSIAYLYARAVMGVRRIDVRTKTVTLSETDATLARGELILPTAEGELVITRTWANGTCRHTCKLPPGWRTLPESNRPCSPEVPCVRTSSTMTLPSPNLRPDSFLHSTLSTLHSARVLNRKKRKGSQIPKRQRRPQAESAEARPNLCAISDLRSSLYNSKTYGSNRASHSFFSFVTPS